MATGDGRCLMDDWSNFDDDDGDVVLLLFLIVARVISMVVVLREFARRGTVETQNRPYRGCADYTTASSCDLRFCSQGVTLAARPRNGSTSIQLPFFFETDMISDACFLFLFSRIDEHSVVAVVVCHVLVFCLSRFFI